MLTEPVILGLASGAAHPAMLVKFPITAVASAVVPFVNVFGTEQAAIAESPSSKRPKAAPINILNIHHSPTLSLGTSLARERIRWCGTKTAKVGVEKNVHGQWL